MEQMATNQTCIKMLREAAWVVISLLLMASSNLASLDVKIVTGDLHQTIVYSRIETNEYQEWCLMLDPGDTDQYLECTLAGPNKEEYLPHCTYATSEFKARQCCQFCCVPLNHNEIEHYVITGGWWEGADKIAQTPGIGQKRCIDQDTYCSAMRNTCDASSTYGVEEEAVEQYVLDHFLDYVPQMWRPSSMQTLT